MLKNKRAAIFLTFVSIFLMVALLYFYTNYGTKDEFKLKNLGKVQLEILETYQEAEKALLYIDLSAKYSAYKTIHNLARVGGSFNDLECGKNNDFTLWNNQDKDCFPENKAIYSEFTTNFNSNLNKYLEKYEESDLKENEKLKIPLNNYDLLFKDKQLIGIATQNLIINKKNINYSIKPSFNIDIDYNISQDYEYLVEKAKEIIEECLENKEPEESISDCVDSLIKDFNGQKELNVIGNTKLEEINKQIEEKEKRLKELEEDKNKRTKPIYTYYEKQEIEQLNSEIKELKDQFIIILSNEEIKIFTWSFEEESDYFMFSVEQNNEFPIYNSKTKKISEEPIIYKFALYLGQTSEVNQ